MDFKEKTKKERLNERNKKIRLFFYDKQKKNPKYKVDVIIKEVADKFFLAPRTIEAIISYEGIYKD